MKKAWILFLIAGLFLTARSTFAQSHSDMDRNLILTEGVAEVTGQNDSVRISISVVSEGPDLKQVSTENAVKTKNVIDGIKDLNLKNMDFKTSDYRVTPQRDYKARPPKIKGYEVYNTIDIKLEEMDPNQLSEYVSKVIGNALENGANSINYIQSYIKNRTPLEKEALMRATQEAKDRAETLAKAAGVNIKRIVKISTQPESFPPRPQMLRSAVMKAEAAPVSPPIEIGESQVLAHVSMVFEIE
jgi:uncharacterized protein YggE